MNVQMIVEGLSFEHVTDVEPLRAQGGAVQEFLPQSRYANVRRLPLNKYGLGPFCKFTIPPGFRKSGVYLLVEGANIRYVGECANLNARFNAGYGNISPKNCFKGGQETNCRLNSLIYASLTKGERLELFFHQTSDYKRVEAMLRATLKAPWNRI